MQLQDLMTQFLITDKNKKHYLAFLLALLLYLLKQLKIIWVYLFSFSLSQEKPEYWLPSDSNEYNKYKKYEECNCLRQNETNKSQHFLRCNLQFGCTNNQIVAVEIYSNLTFRSWIELANNWNRIKAEKP